MGEGRFRGGLQAPFPPAVGAGLLLNPLAGTGVQWDRPTALRARAAKTRARADVSACTRESLSDGDRDHELGLARDLSLVRGGSDNTQNT